MLHREPEYPAQTHDTIPSINGPHTINLTLANGVTHNRQFRFLA